MRTFLVKLKAAINGITFLVASERHFRYHLIAATFVFFVGWITHLSNSEWLFVLSAIFSVLIAEAFNSCIEKVCDEITLERKTSIKRIKDMAAGAVLIAVIYSIIVGLFVFSPKVFAVMLG